MEISVDEIVTAAAAILIASLLQPLLPETITDIDPLTFLNNPYLRVVLIAIIAFALLWWLLSWARNTFGNSGSGGRSAAFVATARGKPRRDVSEWEVDKFGVKWRVLHGRQRSLGDAYAYADSPVCPECGTDLMTDTKSRRFRDDKPIWKCPGCGFTQGRPSRFLYEESDAVEREVEREARSS